MQGLRCVAVLFVVAFHAGLPLPGGFTGVDIFFAISGFVITGTLARHHAASGRLDLLSFYARRVKRLLPALALMLVVVAAAGILLAPVGGVPTGAGTGRFASLFAANGYVYRLPTGYFDVGADLNPLLHTWTLGVEEQFYLVFPLLLLGGWILDGRRPGRRVGLPVVAVAGILVVSFGLALVLPQKLAFYASPTRAWEFAAGALVALLGADLERLGRRGSHGLAVFGTGTLVAGAILAGSSRGPVFNALLPVVGTCALLAAGTAAATPVTRWLGAAPLVRIGDLSYSWYLWHWPLIVFASALWLDSGVAQAVAGAVSLAPAWLSHRYVENPVRFDPRIRGRRVIALAGVCIAVPILACSAWQAAHRRLMDTNPALATVQRSQMPSAGQARHCYGVLGRADRQACTWRVSRPRGSLVLLGDSTATVLSEPFVAAARRLGFDATVATLPGCPFVGLRVRGRFSRAACPAAYERSLEAVLRSRPTLLVVANTSTYVWDPVLGLAPPEGGAFSHRQEEKARLWGRARASLLRALDARDIPVLVVLPTPIAETLPTACATLRVMTHECLTARPRAAVDRELRQIAAAERRAAREADAAAVVDPTDVLCGPDVCPSTRGGIVIHKDRMHLSVGGAGLLTDRLTTAIDALGVGARS